MYSGSAEYMGEDYATFYNETMMGPNEEMLTMQSGVNSIPPELQAF